MHHDFMYLFRRWRPVPHRQARDCEEGQQGAGRGHQVKGASLPVQRGGGKDGAHHPTGAAQEQGQANQEAGSLNGASIFLDKL